MKTEEKPAEEEAKGNEQVEVAEAAVEADVPVVNAAVNGAATQLEIQNKDNSQKEVEEVKEQKLSQASSASKKRTMADLRARQEAAEPAPETIAEQEELAGEDDDKRPKEQE